jgi:hypothetical protein
MRGIGVPAAGTSSGTGIATRLENLRLGFLRSTGRLRRQLRTKFAQCPALLGGNIKTRFHSLSPFVVGNSKSNRAAHGRPVAVLEIPNGMAKNGF